MDEILERVKANRPALERWLRFLPGYAGYKEKEQRRDADRILRETIRQRLRELADRLLVLQRELAERELSRVDEIDRVVRRIQTLADQVGVARYGYAGFFDAVRIGEVELEALYRFDADLLQKIEELQGGVDVLAQVIRGGGDLPAALRPLESQLQELQVLWERRSELMIRAS